jgi:nucleoside-diphosphate-sugar epimerase
MSNEFEGAKVLITGGLGFTLIDSLIAEYGGNLFNIEGFQGRVHVNRRPIDIGDYYADFSKIRSELGWTPQRTLRQAIESLLAYYREFLSHYL